MTTPRILTAAEVEELRKMVVYRFGDSCVPADPAVTMMLDSHEALRARLEAAERVVEAAREIHEGTRDYAARGMGQNLPVEFEMPPSTAKKVRRALGDALAAYDKSASNEQSKPK